MHRRALRLPGRIAAALLATTIAAGCVDPPLFPEPLAPDAMRAEIRVDGVPRTIAAGASTSLRIHVRNLSRTTWPADGDVAGAYRVNVACGWLDETGSVRARDVFRRTALPHRVRPGDRASVVVDLQAPPWPGTYVLHVDLVQETVAWFGDAGSRPFQAPVEVSAERGPTGSSR